MILEFQFTPDEWREAEDAQGRISTQKMYSTPLRSVLFLLQFGAIIGCLVMVMNAIKSARFPPHPAVIALFGVFLGIALLSRRILRRSLVSKPPAAPSGFVDLPPRRSSSPGITPLAFPLVFVLALVMLSLSNVRTASTSTLPTAAPPPLVRDVVWKVLLHSTGFYVTLIGSILMLIGYFLQRGLRKSAIGTRHRVTITAGDITFDNGANVSRLPWSAITRYVETPRLFFILPLIERAQILPKRALSPVELLEFRSLLQSNVQPLKPGFPVQPSAS